MAKYIDQVGAQHFAEALMASTKTIGGQTIWGSGNIEAGGGTTIVTLTSAADFDTYKSVLESNDYKVVLFDFKSADITGKTVTINNATLISNGGNFQNNYEGSNIRKGSIIFKNCRSGSRDSGSLQNGYPGLLLSFTYVTDIQFINCHITFGPSCDIDYDEYHAIFASCDSAKLYQSYIEFFGYSYEYSDTPDSLTLYDSIIKGFRFANDTLLDLNSSMRSAAWMSGYPYIANRIINCDLTSLTSMTMNGSSNNKVITNTLFECCKMPPIINNGVVGICNVLSCDVPGGTDTDIIFAAPGDIILASNSDLADYREVLKSNMPKNVYFIEPQNGFTAANNNHEFNNCTLYTTKNGASISCQVNLKFQNCKSGGNISIENISKFCKFHFKNTLQSNIIFEQCVMNITTHTNYTILFENCYTVSLDDCIFNGYASPNKKTCLFDAAEVFRFENHGYFEGFLIDGSGSVELSISGPVSTDMHFTFKNCDINVEFNASFEPYLQSTQFVNCKINSSVVSNIGELYNVQRCTIGAFASDNCHPYILSNQQVDETAAGGFNTIL